MCRTNGACAVPVVPDSEGFWTPISFTLPKNLHLLPALILYLLHGKCGTLEKLMNFVCAVISCRASYHFMGVLLMSSSFCLYICPSKGKMRSNFPRIIIGFY